MARFDVYPHPEGKGAGLLLDIQADLMRHLDSRLVIPLLPPNTAPLPIKVLNPVFDYEGMPYLMLTQQMAGVSLRILKNPLFNAAGRRDEIVAAIDLLLQGL